MLDRLTKSVLEVKPTYAARNNASTISETFG
jgi:hypothetical protein